MRIIKIFNTIFGRKQTNIHIIIYSHYQIELHNQLIVCNFTDYTLKKFLCFDKITSVII